MPHLIGKMKKFDLKAIFKEITNINCDINTIPNNKNEEFELLDKAVNQLKKIYYKSDYYNLLELYEYRKTSVVYYLKPGDTFGIEEILKYPKKNSDETAFEAIANTHLLIIDKFPFMTILGKNFLKAVNDRQKYIVSLCPFILSTNYSRQILRKSRYIYPTKGEAIYSEKQSGDFIYLIIKGSCVLKKKIYNDIQHKYSTIPIKFESNYNFAIPSRSKMFNIISLGVGSFVGIEILFDQTIAYKYTLEVNDNNTLLCEFNFKDFYYSGIENKMKNYLKEVYEIQEKHFTAKLNSLNENNLAIDYRNIMKNEFFKQTFPENLVENCRKRIKLRESKVNCKIMRRLSLIHLNGEKEKDNGKQGEQLNNQSQTNISGQFFDNAKISAFMTALSPLSSRTLLKSSSKILKETKIINKIEKIKNLKKKQVNNRKKVKNSLIDFVKSDIDSPLVLSLNNWMNSNKSYTTRSFKIPLVVMLKKTMKKCPSSVVFNKCLLP